MNTGAARLWRTAAQRRVRASFTSIATARCKWEKAADEGLSAATSLVNAILSARFAGELPMGRLSDLPSLGERVRERYAEQAGQAMLRLGQAAVALQEAHNALRSAAGGLSAEEGTGTPPPGLQDAERIVPVFSALPLAAFCKLAGSVVEMYGKELAVKQILTAAFQDAATAGGSGGGQPGQGPQATREALQLCLAVWMLEPELDKARVDQVMDHIAEELSSLSSP